ncbi:general stress protein [Bacillus sp. FJAT-49736]|uniref:general stress protein n=1 Tax=Bacillus sp. FJAT-49736 TaxID=2833582 RepID=UPI001BC9AAE4|nr:general stress protein [Bacillus sp. FJAT-49736]MBS4175365.1 general stress protein [Bacillus sp. FJAT-49736]
MYTVKVAENGLDASNLVSELQNEGYRKENVYIFAHQKGRSKDLTDATNTGSVGIEEQGILDSFGNVFKKRGDELRSKMKALGLSKMEAEKYEEVLDEGKLVVIASEIRMDEPPYTIV